MYLSLRGHIRVWLSWSRLFGAVIFAGSMLISVFFLYVALSTNMDVDVCWIGGLTYLVIAIIVNELFLQPDR